MTRNRNISYGFGGAVKTFGKTTIGIGGRTLDINPKKIYFNANQVEFIKTTSKEFVSKVYILMY